LILFFQNINSDADRFTLEVKDPSLSHVKESLDKPQIKFNFDIDNSDLPFVPKLTKKPHGLVALDSNILRAQTSKESFFENIQNVIFA
jgi:hypothetical protein